MPYLLTHGPEEGTPSCCSFHGCLCQRSWLPATRTAPASHQAEEVPLPFLDWPPPGLLQGACPSPSWWRERALITSIVFPWSPSFHYYFGTYTLTSSSWWKATPFRVFVLENLWPQSVGSSYSLMASSPLCPLILSQKQQPLVPPPTSTTSLRLLLIYIYLITCNHTCIMHLCELSMYHTHIHI